MRRDIVNLEEGETVVPELKLEAIPTVFSREKTDDATIMAKLSRHPFACRSPSIWPASLAAEGLLLAACFLVVNRIRLTFASSIPVRERIDWTSSAVSNWRLHPLLASPRLRPANEIHLLPCLFLSHYLTWPFSDTKPIGCISPDELALAANLKWLLKRSLVIWRLGFSCNQLICSMAITYYVINISKRHVQKPFKARIWEHVEWKYLIITSPTFTSILDFWSSGLLICEINA